MTPSGPRLALSFNGLLQYDTIQWRICTQKLTNCQFNLAHKLKRTEMFKRKMKLEILRIELLLNVKLTKFEQVI